MQSVLAEAKATLSETQPTPPAISQFGLCFPLLGWTGIFHSGGGLRRAQPACSGYLLFSDCTSLDSSCF